MEITAEQVTQLAKISAQMVVDKLHRYALTYQEPATIEQGLMESMGEELTATDWYRRRAKMARDLGDEQTALLYEDILNDEENDHYPRLAKRLEEIRRG